MKMTSRLATLLTIFATTGPLLSATELDRLRAKCAEQEMQISQLETKIARLTDTPPPSRANAPREFQPISDEDTYTVKAGDSIERIANNHGTSPASLAKLNGLKSNAIIHPGQKLKVPGKSTVASAASTSPPVAKSQSHTVQTGETFYSISRKYGVSVDKLIAANPNVNHRAMRVGQTIRISSTQTQIADAPSKKATSKPIPSLDSSASLPVANNKPIEKPRISDKPVKIQKEITYGQFAENFHTTTQRLDELNGLELDPTTVLAQGSELYIPAQP